MTVRGYQPRGIRPGTAAGEILVWNGTAWVPSSAATVAPAIHYVNRAADFTDNTGAFVDFLELTITPTLPRLLLHGHVNGQAAALGGYLRMQILEDGVVVRQAWVFASGASTPQNGGDCIVVRSPPVGVAVVYKFQLASNGAGHAIYCRPVAFPAIEYGSLHIVEGRAP